MPADQDSPYTPVYVVPSMVSKLLLCRRCGALTIPVDPACAALMTPSPQAQHDRMHDTLDSIAAILEQHREVMDRD